MSWRFTHYVIPLAFSAVLSGALAVYALRRRREAPAAGAFALLMASICWWSAAYGLLVSGRDLATQWRWLQIEYLGIVTIPVAWLLLALRHTGRDAWITPRNLALASIVPASTLVGVWTNEFHGLFFGPARLAGEELILSVAPGPWYWINVAYVYIALLLGALLLLARLRARVPLKRAQAGSMLVALLIPWVSNLVFLAGARSVRLDPTPFAMALAGLVFAWALFRQRLLRLLPVAREALADRMGDGMLVLDAERRVAFLNPAAARDLATTADCALGRPAQEVLANWSELAACLRGAAAEGVITVGDGGARRHYDVRVTPLAGREGSPQGSLLTWHDVTAFRRVEADLAGERKLTENLLAVARATTERPTLEATLQSTLGVASSLTGAQASALILLDEHGVAGGLFSAGERFLDMNRALVDEAMRSGLSGWVARERRTALVHDVREDSRCHGKDLGIPVRSVLCVPIRSGSALVGILVLTHAQPGHFGADHQRLIEAAADQIALALLNAQVFDALGRMAERQTLLYEVLRTVGSQLDTRRVARAAVARIAERTRWSGVAIALPSEDGSRWRFEASWAAVLASSELEIGQGVIGRAHKSGLAQVVPDTTQDPDYVALLPGARSELAVPIRLGERALGVLDLESERPAAFTTDDVALGRSLADAVALALDNSRLYLGLAAEHERLLALERLRDELTHMLVHDLRNPLTSLGGLLQALGEGRGTDVERKEARLLELAQRSTDRMARLVDAILEMSRLEAGCMPVSCQPLALGPLLMEATEVQAPIAQRKRVRLEIETLEGGPDVIADRELLVRVLQNLFGNAVKFSPEGGRVRVAAALDEGPPPMLRVSVSDDGPGVPEELRGRLFQKFAAGGPGKGSGLGLAFCRLAVEAQGGRIWLDSSHASGATFRFSLPAAEARAAPA